MLLGAGGLNGAGVLGASPACNAQLDQGVGYRTSRERGEIVIRKADFLTVDDALGGPEATEFHVKRGEIVSIGPHLAMPPAPRKSTPAA
ncbi:hypothetical protein BVG79_00978 [Ketogulonicigenium robustum]|uniref:Uncharacterized protein n=1 Tax=Ketogulonicigenium robustum TaxID=92947 RepID=A0A1W6NYK6_9RHOB|nr:hypothetical protein BVG79_00978 [Ketogulonicigenium robustum]